MHSTDEDLGVAPSAWQGQLFKPDDAHPSGWPQAAARAFTDRMTSESARFPCVFGVDATRRGTLRLAFVAAGPGSDAALARALEHFARVAPSIGSRTSLVCLFEPDPALAELDDYRKEFWRRLQSLHDIDTSPWPNGVDVDPESSTWEFSFAGTPFFVVANTPAHRRRMSRHLDYFAITFQPRFVFDNLGENSKQGANARRVIRRRLAEYDDLARTPTLGSFGANGNREWVQYFLEDHNDPIPADVHSPFSVNTCPHLKKGSSMSTRTTFDSHELPDLPAPLVHLLPQQGSIELQNDSPGKTHDWHYHTVAEELLVLAGSVMLVWKEQGAVEHRPCGAGTRITLAAETAHASTAGPDGAVYLIRPLDGGADTVWLAPDARPATNAA